MSSPTQLSEAYLAYRDAILACKDTEMRAMRRSKIAIFVSFLGLSFGLLAESPFCIAINAAVLAGSLAQYYMAQTRADDLDEELHDVLSWMQARTSFPSIGETQ